MRYKFLVFSYENFYPGGGMEDCILKTNDPEAALKAATEAKETSIDIYNAETGETFDVPEFVDYLKK